MALSDLSYVTRTLIELLNQSFIVSNAWQATAPTIVPEPPSRLGSNGLGLYLYHVQENAAYKNLPAPGGSRNAIRFNNLALTLYYQLSANSESTQENEAAYVEQTMIGVAMKALHDYPEINDDTRVNGVQVMHALIRGLNNHFKIAFQPVPYTEAVQYWTAGTSPLKLSAYYEVTVVLLEPEDMLSRAGRVLTYGVHTFVEGAPQLINSQNIVTYNAPGILEPRQVKTQPAQVAPNALPDSTITILGSGMRGDRVELLLLGRWTSWNNQLAVTDNTWNVQSQDHVLTADVQETALLLPPDPDATPSTAVQILPGIYGMQVRVTRVRVMPDGQSRNFVHTSNQIPLIITPRIDSIVPPGGVSYFSVQGYRWQHADLDLELIQLYLGPTRLFHPSAEVLALRADPDVPEAGEFVVIDATNLRFHLPNPSNFESGTNIPIRIIINGAESPPRWILIP
ncbi:MAG: DUF4255 domain-containing protein [Chitinophagales bacterium]|nr:DUF4255 domain-containing protein [Chitinophagales bacterium]